MGVIDSGYDITQLCSGAVRGLIVPHSDESIPTNLADIIALVNSGGAYAATGNWKDLGATTGPANYARSFESEGQTVEQIKGNVLEEITDISRSMTFPFGALDADMVKIIENADGIGTIAAGSNTSSQKQVKVGKFSELTRYRVCLVGMRPLEAGKVIEPDGTERGRLLAQVLYNCTLATDEASFEFAKGSLASAEVGFTAFPETSEPSNEEDGTWFDEDAQTITA